MFISHATCDGVIATFNQRIADEPDNGNVIIEFGERIRYQMLSERLGRVINLRRRTYSLNFFYNRRTGMYSISATRWEQHAVNAKPVAHTMWKDVTPDYPTAEFLRQCMENMV